MTFIGFQLDIIPHTSIIAFGQEFWFGSGGVQSEPPFSGSATGNMPVHQTLELGETEIPRDCFLEFLDEISPRFTPVHYNLLSHNCNHFTHEVALFLLGKGLPSEIIDLPARVLATPQGRSLSALISQLGPAMDPLAQGRSPQPVPPVLTLPMDPCTPSTVPPVSAPTAAGGAPVCSAVPTPQTAAAVRPIVGARCAVTATVPPQSSHCFATPAPHEGIPTRLPNSSMVTPVPSRSPQLAAARPLISLQGPTAAVLTKFQKRLAQDKAASVYGGDKATQVPIAGEVNGSSCVSKQLSVSSADLLAELSSMQLTNPEAIGAPLAAELGKAFARLLHTWEVREHFILLFLCRLLVRNERFLSAWCSEGAISALPLRGAAAAAARAARLMGFTALSNSASNASCLQVLLGHEVQANELLEAALATSVSVDPQEAQSAAAFVYNVALALPTMAQGTTAACGQEIAEQAWLQLLSGLPQALVAQGDAEARRRLIVALGHLLLRGGESKVELARALGIDADLIKSLTPEARDTPMAQLLDEVRALL